MKQIITKEIKDGIRLHLFDDNKFNTLTLKLFFVRPLDKNATKASLLSKVLKRGTQCHQTTKKLKNAFENNYGSLFRTNVKKIGENHLVEISIHMPDKKIIGQEDGQIAFSKSIKLLKEVIFKPYMEDSLLGEKYVEQEKMSLAQEINAIYNDKEQWALQRCIELTCKDEPYRIPSKGRLQELELINNKVLTEFYNDLIENSQVEMFVSGDFSIEDTTLIEKDILSELEPREKLELLYDKTFTPENVREKQEYSNVNQGKLVISLRSHVNPCSDLMPAFILYNGILGGGTYSKLFNIVREKNSLAYYVHSISDRNKQILFIEAGINKENYDKAKKLIRNIIDDIRAGKISDDEIYQAKESVVNSLWSLEDYSGGNINYFLMGLLCDCPLTPAEMEKRIRAVTKADIKEVANQVFLDLIYFLMSKNGGE